MTAKSEAASEYPARFEGALLSAIKLQMIPDAAITRPGDDHTELEGTWEIDVAWIDPKRLGSRRQEEI